jgi:predicted alpha/beta hydrolase
MKTIELKAPDGFVLTGQLYGEPARCHSALLIVPAMGVAQRYYADFAQWLAAQGHAVLTFDYRGIGASRPERWRRSLRGLQADVSTWAEQDTAAALAWLDARLPSQTPLHWLGHSLGGQILGLVPGRERIARVVTIGVGTGYWRHQSFKTGGLAALLWYVIAPVALRWKGYFPGRTLRLFGDLPLGVMQQWRRWCLQRDYVVSEGGPQRRAVYAAIQSPMLSLSFTDDEYMSARNTTVMHSFYANAPREMRRVAPADVGVPSIGHFGFFRSRFAATLWPQVAQWLAAPLQTPSTQDLA